MPLIYQSPTSPDEVAFALQDLVRDDLYRIRIAVAYVTRAGCRRLVGAIEEKLGPSALQSVSKLLVTSFDFGHTEPEALNYWRLLPKSEIRIANVQRVQGNLSLVSANANFHPKVYFFDHPRDVATLVGSANLTRRALTVNAEVAFADGTADLQAVDRMWVGFWDSSETLTDQLLSEYRLIRGNRSLPDFDMAIQASPARHPEIGQRLIDAIEEGLDPSQFQCMWIQAGSMTSGGSRNQLELPRGANRFFGYNYNEYAPEYVTVGQPVLNSRGQRWTDRTLTWHAGGGQNAMERLNLPTVLQGGYDYVNTVILFRRTQHDFEFSVVQQGVDQSNAWLNASANSGTLFRTGFGINSRMCGLF